MSDTPRTKKVSHFAFDDNATDYDAYVKMLYHARNLERELNAANAEIKRLKAACDAGSEDEILNPRSIQKL